ncbi:MAG TPA: methionine biosynthesis protein MetW [Gammaproteobacteria bacterium]|jgi:methionine biosynthesis protein MetW|uniref:Methionine biosynthesis protein MetW n=4 Tax=OM182 clade TaxID=745002 RepID=A0A0R2T2I6_9GAMM|nr:MAG: methionine biosynthesis protein MetW [OM182 bacterium BACL3 MAG-120619-bin3]KRP29580.1 MAG: methionine biosynthesis protein MetW [OM182 bacterium BACL3 MAG-120924-bin41]KRP37964.1 MAG: methionine biosynthesis protein MetW [OM182 bacterium BACL3 MAG-120531-bin86]MBT3522155.1 methionine biosynthesis protein MetW [Gammaproteobacteria bacterium]MDO7639235.1 methionine biosynthesis protein MetW [OM182 bacterium]
MRPDQEIIQRWIEPDSRVLDLGCGDGSLLANLKLTKKVKGTGLEIDSDKIQTCVERGLNVIEQNLDAGLWNFQTDSFDTVLLAQTLQALSHPDQLIDEMLRVGRRGIVTFPNFGNWKSRVYLSSKGRMPVSKFMPHAWYDTPNIHFCTVRDFDALCKEKNIRILERTVVDLKHEGSLSMRLLPNLLGEIAIYHIARS